MNATRLMLRRRELLLPPPPPAFEVTVDTTGTGFTDVLLPLSGGMFDVDWGDGTDTLGATSAPVHDYGVEGVWQVRVTGTANRLGSTLDARWQQTVAAVTDWGPLGITNLNSAFRECTRAFTVPATLPPNVTSLLNTFLNATAFAGDVSGWDTSSVTSMANTFNGATAFGGGVSAWDTSAVTTMSGMWVNSNANPNVSGWTTSALTSAANMFNGASNADPNLSGWNVTSLETATAMLFGSAFSDANYDLLLVAWEAQNVQLGVAFHAGTARYGPGAPAAARTSLIVGSLWTITDGGPQ